MIRNDVVKDQEINVTLKSDPHFMFLLLRYI